MIGLDLFHIDNVVDVDVSRELRTYGIQKCIQHLIGADVLFFKLSCPREFEVFHAEPYLIHDLIGIS